MRHFPSGKCCSSLPPLERDGFSRGRTKAENLAEQLRSGSRFNLGFRGGHNQWLNLLCIIKVKFT